MGVLQRLIGSEKPRLAVHTFMAVVAEFKRGEISGAEAVAMYGGELSAAEVQQVSTWLQDAGTAGLTREEVHDALLLGSDGRYTEAQVKARLNNLGD